MTVTAFAADYSASTAATDSAPTAALALEVLSTPGPAQQLILSHLTLLDE